MENILSLKKISLPIFIGESAKEREKTQEMLVSIDIKFLKTPSSVTHDNLKDGICYDKVIKILLEAIQDQNFFLIEHFAYFCYKKLKDKIEFKETFLLKVLVQKPHPPISNLKGGAFYLYGDKF